MSASVNLCARRKYMRLLMRSAHIHMLSACVDRFQPAVNAGVMYLNLIVSRLKQVCIKTCIDSADNHSGRLVSAHPYLGVGGSIRGPEGF